MQYVYTIYYFSGRIGALYVSSLFSFSTRLAAERLTWAGVPTIQANAVTVNMVATTEDMAAIVEETMAVAAVAVLSVMGMEGSMESQVSSALTSRKQKLFDWRME